MHCAATLTMTRDPNTPVETYPPMPTEPRQMCHARRVGEPPIRGKDDGTTDGKPLHRLLQHRLLYVIGHTATGVFQDLPYKRNGSSTLDDREAHHTVRVP